MKKLAIGLLLVLAGIGAVGLAIVQTTVHAAYAGSSSSGSLATDEFAGSSSSASIKGPSGYFSWRYRKVPSLHSD